MSMHTLMKRLADKRPARLPTWLAMFAVCSAAAGCSGGDGPQGDAPTFTPAAHRLYPQVEFGGGSVMRDMRLVTVVAQGDSMADSLFAFGDVLVVSAWYTTMGGEYGVGAAASSVHITAPPLPTTTPLDRAAVEDYLHAAIAGAESPPEPDGRTMYVLYLSDGIDLDDDIACGSVNGHHAPFGDLGDGFAVVNRCQGDARSMLEAVTVAGSHEIAEAVTDTDDGWHLPIPPAVPGWQIEATPWLSYNGPNNPYQPHVEIGDLCNDTRFTEGGFVFQRTFSDAAAAAGEDPCVPHLAIPYYSVSTPQDWFAGQPGETVSIPVAGWSSAPTEDWFVTVALKSPTREGFAVATRSDTTTTVGGTTLEMVNDARVITLDVTIPASAASGDRATMYLESARVDADGIIGPVGDDLAHRWMVGVYVP